MDKQLSLSFNRIIFVYKSGKWERLPDFNLLQEGDIFCMFEPDNKQPVKDAQYLNSTFKAESSAFINNGVWSVQCSPVDHIPFDEEIFNAG